MMSSHTDTESDWQIFNVLREASEVHFLNLFSFVFLESGCALIFIQLQLPGLCEIRSV